MLALLVIRKPYSSSHKRFLNLACAKINQVKLVGNSKGKQVCDQRLGKCASFSTFLIAFLIYFEKQHFAIDCQCRNTF